MDNVRLGPVGRLSVYRPVLTTLVLALGLTAAVAAATRRDPGAAAFIGDLVIASLALVCGPSVVAVFAPNRFLMRAIYAVAVAGLAVGGLTALERYGAAPAIAGSGPVWFAVFAGALILLGRVIGPPARLAAVSTLSAALGAAGAYGFLSLQGAASPQASGPVLAIIPALAAAPALNLVVAFSDGFAGGLDRRQAAGLAARHSAAPTLFVAVFASLSFMLAQISAPDAASLQASGLAFAAGLAVLVAAVPAFAITAGALAARRHTEQFAVVENRRRQAFRLFWRPWRSIFSPSASLAAVAVGSIIVIAAVFDTAGRTPVFQYAEALAAGVLAAIVFVSLRAGVFVFVLMLIALAIVEWIWLGASLPALPAADAAAAMTVVGAFFAQAALIWRNARSPRLNARETTERAMALAAPALILSAVAVAAAFAAVHVAGYWPGAPLALAYAGAMAFTGGVLAPAAMTALSQIAPRDLG